MEGYDVAVVGWVHCQVCGLKAPSGTAKKVRGLVMCVVCRERVGDHAVYKCKVCGVVDVAGAMVAGADGNVYCEECGGGGV